MKITIHHDQNSIDPNAQCSDEEFAFVIDQLERAYERAIQQSYPDAEIEFERGDYCGDSVIVSHHGVEDPTDDRDEIEAICARVFEAGDFWS